MLDELITNISCISTNDLGRNVALKQPTWQSSNYSENGVQHDSSRAVDGNTSHKFSAHQSCTHTTDGSPGSWKVTFSQPWYLNRYVLYNRGTRQFKSTLQYVNI